MVEYSIRGASVHSTVYCLLRDPRVDTLGRLLVIIGVAPAVMGALMVGASRLPFPGRLPGDLTFRWGGGTVYFPIVTSILLSVALTVLLNLLLRLLNRS